MGTIATALLLAILPSAGWAQSSYEDEPSFGGVKVGVDAEYRWADGEFRVPTLAEDLDENRGGIGYRGRIGFDMPFANIVVVGAEASLGRGGPTLRTENATGDYALKPGWNWDISGRVGVQPAPSLLIYGRGGRSWLRTREQIDFSSGSRTDIDRWHTESGFLYGGGIEAALSAGSFVRAEYNRVNYGEGLTASRALIGLSLGF